MKGKVLNVFLILTSLMGYLEWGTDSKMFLFQMEQEILARLFTDPSSVMHPFVLLPLFGQVCFIISLFQKKPGKMLTFLGLGTIAVLLVLILFIGIINQNIKILISTLPFITAGILTILHHRKRKTVSGPTAL